MPSNTDTRYVPMLFEHPVGNGFDEWRENVRKTELYQRGDTVLIWVNEGDLYPGPFVAEASRPPVQTDGLVKLAAYLRRQGEQCNRQQPVVPVAGSELLKAADALASLVPEATRDDAPDEITALRTTLAALQRSNAEKDEALREIENLPGEINPSNYDHDDVCELNRQFCHAVTIARKALSHSSETDDD
jgi:hypothetical protein